jgi:hypothetical protein
MDTPLRHRLRRALQAWRRIARIIADFQGWVLLTVFYGLLVVPIGPVLRFLADPLSRRRPSGSNWRPRRDPPPTLDEARRQ